MACRLARLPAFLGEANAVQLLLPGKMLRTQLVARLVEAGASRIDLSVAARLCAATELAHTASLCHDDVIDGGLLRRGHSTLWRATSESGAVLTGDLLLCEATSLLLETDEGHHLPAFIDKVREVCSAEAEQELVLRGNRLDRATCVRIARGKTGPLFAFTPQICAGDDAALAAALEAAGYDIGTAYQLADDLLDAVGDEAEAGKTLGTDLARRKFTIAHEDGDGLPDCIRSLCAAALERLDAHPKARGAVEQFLLHDLQAAFDRYALDLAPVVKAGM